MRGTYKGGDGNNGADGGLGGGISSDGNAISVSNTTIVANTAGDGGAGGAPGFGYPLSIDNLGNPGLYGVGGDGGGLRIRNPDNALVANDTIAANAASKADFETPGSGGGIWLESPVTLRNTLLASNRPGGNCGPATSAFVNGGHNLSFGDSSCPNTFAAGDPELGPLKNNGGPTQTMALGSGSAATNQVPVAGAHCPATDQRGVARPSGPACDIGAYERAAPKITPGSITTTSRRATVTDFVLANQAQAGVYFEFGLTAHYGLKTATQHVFGLASTPISTTFTGLKPFTTYHYRAHVASSDGSTTGPDQTFTTKPVTPVLSNLAVRKHRVSYTDSERATTTLTISRCKNRSCTRRKRIDTLTHHDKAGPNTVNLPKLRPGHYRLTARPRIATLTGHTLSARFKIA